MTSASDRGKCQTLGTACFSRNFPCYPPLSQLLRGKFLLSGPFQLHRPFLVTNMIANPIVLAHIDEDLYASFQKRRDVVVSLANVVEVANEGSTDIHRGESKIPLRLWVNSELRLYF